MSAIYVSAEFLYFERDKVNTDLSHPPWSKHTLWLVVHSVNERILTVGEEYQREVVLGCQDGGRVVEDAVGVASLQAGSAIKQERFKVADSKNGLLVLSAGFQGERYGGILDLWSMTTKYICIC